MAGVLKIVNGYSPEYLLKEVATGRENYYTGAVAEGEPPGRWWGAGAENLGLTGLVDAQDMRAVYERFLDPREDGFKDPQRWDEVFTLGHTGRGYATEDELYAKALEQEPDAAAERRAELRTEAGRSARHNVAFYDATFSVQKSITLIHTAFEAREVAARAAGDEETAAAWGQFRKAVEDAIWAGNNAGLAYLSEKAGYTRMGHHGGAAGRYADAHDWVVASFFQHDSRDRDPQLHIHNTILNRVESPDGTWRTVDGRSLHRWRPAAAAVAERTTEERITHAVGTLLATRPDGKSREIVGVSAEAMSLISTRRHAVTARTADLVEAFEERHGRAPNGYERERLAQQATLATRKGKSHDGETREQLLDRIEVRLRADIEGGLSGIADSVLAAREQQPAVQEWSPRAVIEMALEEVQQRKSGWTEADLIRAINSALPDYLGLADGSDIGTLLDQLADEAIECVTPLDAARPGHELLPDELLLDNGQSAYQAPGGRLYATPAHVYTERALVAAATSAGKVAMPSEIADRFLIELAATDVELGVDQAAAVRGVLTSGQQVQTLVGPAGTGKSFVVGTLAHAWTDPELTGGAERRVFGLATSQVATEVLAGEGLTARNITQWLGIQQRLDCAHAEGPQNLDDAGWGLRSGDLVVIDESAMTDTAALAAVHSRVEDAGASLLLVGDHKQLAAVGAGGGMELIGAAGASYELAEARRFTHDWERAASLRLRDGDPTVLSEYHRQGRLLDAGTVEQAEQSATDAWLADTLAGKQSLLLVDTNTQAARLSAQIRTELVRLGQVGEHGVELAQGTYAGVGDVVQARRNGWELIGVEGNAGPPINRETYRVTAVRDDGAIEATRIGSDQALVLPAGYVATDLDLGYASTVHAAQGASVDTTHSVVTTRTGSAAFYVESTRGRDANTAHVATVVEVDDSSQGGDRYTLRRSPIAVIESVLEQARPGQSALALAAESRVEADSVRAPAELLADAAQLAATHRTAGWLDQLVDDGVLRSEQRAQIAAEDGAVSLTRVLRRAEIASHDPYEVLHDAVADRPLTGSRNMSNVIYSRITAERTFDPVGDSWIDWTPRVDDPQWSRYLTDLALAADEHTARMGREAAAEQPRWALEALGPAPAEIQEREDWQRRAGLVAAYRDLNGRGNDESGRETGDVLGQAPGSGQVEAYAAFRAAWEALDRPEVDRDELELSDGGLRLRIRAQEREAACAPRYVANELAGTRQAADRHRDIAAMRAAEAPAAPDPEQRATLEQAAHDSAALAAVLDARVEQLDEVDQARSQWLAHTAVTRAIAERAKVELASRHVDDEPERTVTAEEWLAARQASDREEDYYRTIIETDVADDAHERDVADLPELPKDEQVIETDVPDVRDVAADEPKPVAEDVVRVPDADEVAASLDQAQRAVVEVRAREAEAAREAAERRSDDLARWHADDTTVEEQYVDGAAEPELSDSRDG